MAKKSVKVDVDFSGAKKLGRKLDRLSKQQEVSFADLFPASFMRKHTEFASFEAMLDAGGFSATTQQEWEAIPEDDLDRFIAGHSQFKNWPEMLRTAGEEWMARQVR